MCNGLVDYNEALWMFVDGKLAAVHQKLYRKKLFSDYIFDIPRQITRGEDMIMNIRLAYASKKDVMFLQENIYHYDMRSDGLYSSTKWSIETLELWYEYYMKSLSDDILKEHETDFLLGRFSNLLEIALSKPFNNKWKRHKFYKDLEKSYSINKNMKLPFKYRALLVENNFVLTLSLIIIKIYNRIK